MSADIATGLLVTGNEEFLRARHTSAFLDLLRAREPDLTLTVASATTVTVHDLHELLGPTLFGGYPVLHLTEGTKLTKDTLAVAAAYVADPTCGLIVEIPKPTEAGGKAVISTLEAAGIVHQKVSPPKNAGDRRTFAQTELRRRGLRATADAVQALVDGEPDYRGIAMRAGQLAADHTDPTGGTRPPTITAEHVNDVVTSATPGGFGVADALLTRDPAAIAVALRAALEAGTVPILIQTACIITLRDLAAVRAGRTSKMPPWKVQKLRGHVRSWDSAAIAQAVHEVGVIGETVKSSNRSQTEVLAALLRAAHHPPSVA